MHFCQVALFLKYLQIKFHSKNYGKSFFNSLLSFLICFLVSFLNFLKLNYWLWWRFQFLRSSWDLSLLRSLLSLSEWMMDNSEELAKLSLTSDTQSQSTSSSNISFLTLWKRGFMFLFMPWEGMSLRCCTSPPKRMPSYWR